MEKLKRIEGLYATISQLIAEYELTGTAVIDSDELIGRIREEVNVYSASLEWYIKQVLRTAAEVGLWQAGYRSVVKGKGYFVNAEKLHKQEYLINLYNNAALEEKTKKGIVEQLLTKCEEEGVQMQMEFTDGIPKLIQTITPEQLIDMLKNDAR